jgi:oxaloacetate decarboxylase beta subunit
MNRIVRPFLVLSLLVSLFMPSLHAGDRVPVTFSGATYLKIFRGSADSVVASTHGELLNRSHRVIGTFSVVSIDQFETIVRAEIQEGEDADRIAYVNIAALSLTEIKFARENSDAYFYIPAGTANGVEVGMKGRVFTERSDGGLFRVMQVEDQRSLCVVTNLEVETRYAELKTGQFENYAEQIVSSTGFLNITVGNLVMMVIGLIFIYIAIAKDYEPLLLVPIGFGILLGNIPIPLSMFNSISIYMIDPITHKYVFNSTGSSVMGIIYTLVTNGVFPPLIFLGIGAMTDFTAMLSNPKLVLLGAAAQIGIFATFLGALALGFSASSAAAIGIIGGADGPTAIFLSSRLAPSLIGPIAIAAYSYMGMVPIIQPPIMRLLTNKEERLIRMKPARIVRKEEKILFPIIGFIVTTLVAPGAIPLLGMLFFGNVLRESGVTARLAKTASSALIDICTILLGLAVGASTTAQVFLNPQSVLIFVLGCVAFGFSTAGGVLFAKLMNVFLKEKINPLIGSAGVSAVPDSARVSEMVGREYDPDNHLLMHAMGPNVAGVIGSAIVAGVFLGLF